MNPSELIDKRIADLADWRGETLANIRKAIHDADPEIVEEWKWMGSPCWYHDGLICVANAHKDKVKLTFSEGASLPDPDKFFNAGLEGVRRARQLTRKPLVAIGGITRANAASVIEAGADSVAVISDLLREPRKSAEEFFRVLR